MCTLRKRESKHSRKYKGETWRNRKQVRPKTGGREDCFFGSTSYDVMICFILYLFLHSFDIPINVDIIGSLFRAAPTVLTFSLCHGSADLESIKPYFLLGRSYLIYEGHTFDWYNATAFRSSKKELCAFTMTVKLPYKDILYILYICTQSWIHYIRNPGSMDWRRKHAAVASNCPIDGAVVARDGFRSGKVDSVSQLLLLLNWSILRVLLDYFSAQLCLFNIYVTTWLNIHVWYWSMFLDDNMCWCSFSNLVHLSPSSLPTFKAFPLVKIKFQRQP